MGMGMGMGMDCRASLAMTVRFLVNYAVLFYSPEPLSRSRRPWRSMVGKTQTWIAALRSQ